MIARLEGIVLEKTPTRILLDVQGVGYEMLVPVSTFERLSEVNQKAALLTYLHVREDILQLYGFSTPQEKALFTSLISVSGVGPKLALGILSGSSVADLRSLIANGEVEALTRISGVGKKTAQRLVMELRDKLGAGVEDSSTPPSLAGAPSARKLEEAVLALVALGYNRNSAERALSAILAKEPDLPVDELVKRALQSV